MRHHMFLLQDQTEGNTEDIVCRIHHSQMNLTRRSGEDDGLLRWDTATPLIVEQTAELRGRG